MTLQELTEKLLSLTPAEKAEAIHLLTQSLNTQSRGITKTVSVCGGDACIANTRIPVWVLVNAQKLGVSEAQLLLDYPTLSATDLTNAWIYYQTHLEEIETSIRENEEY